jgi:hypothetical protein
LQPRKPRRPRPKADTRDIVEEIVRRMAAADGSDSHYNSYVVRLSDPPTTEERLQLMACRMLGRQIAIMPAKCLTVAEWIKRYGLLNQ